MRYHVGVCSVFFFFKQKTAYEMRISDWSSDVCSSDLEVIEPYLIQQAPRELRLLTPRIKRMTEPVQQANEAAQTFAQATDGGGKSAKEIGRASCRERVCQYV